MLGDGKEDFQVKMICSVNSRIASVDHPGASSWAGLDRPNRLALACTDLSPTRPLSRRGGYDLGRGSFLHFCMAEIPVLTCPPANAIVTQT